MIDAGVADPEQRAAIRELGITSYMMVPLRTRQGVVGAITFVTSESNRHYTEADLRFAETVADRAAIAIENAWAYQEARSANQLKDEFLATLSHSAVEIAVIDNGRGIDEAFLPHVFERFRQGDMRFTRESGGLGLGLSIARSIVEMHGGTIEAESAGLGRGATIRVRLPGAHGLASVR